MRQGFKLNSSFTPGLMIRQTPSPAMGGPSSADVRWIAF